jgi:hypothetical protein
VWIPVRLSESGKRYRRFFETKEQAQKFIFETRRNGSIELADLAVEEKHVLGVIRQSQKYEPRLLLEAWRRFESEGSGNGALDIPGQRVCLRMENHGNMGSYRTGISHLRRGIRLE